LRAGRHLRPVGAEVALRDLTAGAPARQAMSICATVCFGATLSLHPKREARADRSVPLHCTEKASKTMADEMTQIIERIRQELNLQFTDPKHPGLYERRRRLRDLFKSVPTSRTKELYARLGTSRTHHAISQLFHGRLATETRQELLKLLEDRFPRVQSATVKSTRDCQRDVNFMGQLLPWERNLLALVHDEKEADFKRIGMFIGPIFFPGVMSKHLEMIVTSALKQGAAITIGNNVWFPRAIDTSSDKRDFHDIGWLVHESVHVVDYETAGTEAFFLKSYVGNAIASGFRHDDIPNEKRANRIEAAAKRLIQHFPDLANAIRSCDGNVITTLLTSRKHEYRGFFLSTL
jgi:hypothetical protein